MSDDPLALLVDAIVIGGVLAALFLVGAAAVALVAVGFGFYI